MTTSQNAWDDTTAPPAARARALVAAMTLEQKIHQLHGQMATIDIYAPPEESDGNQFEVVRHVGAIEELGVPRMRVTNGPVGVGMGDGPDSPPAPRCP